MYEYGGFSCRRAPGFLACISLLVGLHMSGSKLVSWDRLPALIGNIADRAVKEFGCTTTVCSCCWCKLLASDSFFMVNRTLSTPGSRGIDGTITLWSIELWFPAVKVRPWRTSCTRIYPSDFHDILGVPQSLNTLRRRTHYAEGFFEWRSACNNNTNYCTKWQWSRAIFYWKINIEPIHSRIPSFSGATAPAAREGPSPPCSKRDAEVADIYTDGCKLFARFRRGGVNYLDSLRRHVTGLRRGSSRLWCAAKCFRMTAARLAWHGSGIWTTDDVDRGVTGSETGVPLVGGSDQVGYPGLGLVMCWCSIWKVGCCAQWRLVPPSIPTSSPLIVIEWKSELRNNIIWICRRRYVTSYDSLQSVTIIITRML